MIWAAHLAPPSVVTITAAPLGAPEPPTVEPTAQQRDVLTQSTAARELTGAGRAAEANAPSHGDPAPKVEGGDVASGAVVQAVTATITNAVESTTRRRRRNGEVVVTGGSWEFSGP